MEVQQEHRGWPIYRDPIDRKLPDPVEANPTDWHPSTPPACKLWRCFEAMQKMRFLLEGVAVGQSEARVRRFLIHFTVPLYDFFLCVRDLGQTIEGDKQTRDRLSDAECRFVRELQKRYREAVLDNIAAVKAVRDRIGAHTDKAINPSEATALLENLDIHMVAALLNAALLALDKFARLDCFAWFSDGYREGETRLMACEPIVLTLRDGDLELGGLIELTDSPRRHVFDLIGDLIELSAWMFPDGQSPLIVRRARRES